MSLDPFGFNVRTVTHAGQTYFYLTEIASALRAANVSRLASNLDADEVLPLAAVTGRPDDIDTVLITEPAVYKAAIRMRHPAAREMLRFVTHNVLPSLREANAYRMPKKGPKGAAVVRFMREHLASTAEDAA